MALMLAKPATSAIAADAADFSITEIHGCLFQRLVKHLIC